ncbi:MAG: methyltransferase [Gammaproteobacteria bacterium]
MDLAAASMAGARLRPAAAFDFLCVDAFLETAIEALALHSAFELGVIDFLAARASAATDQIPGELDRLGRRLLVDRLRANNVVHGEHSALRLTPDFRNAIEFRDLLEAKLELARIAIADVADDLAGLLRAPGPDRCSSRIFELFRYDRCFEPTPENIEATARWMHITTAFTRYESRGLLAHFAITPYHRLLDIGGNSGELALRLCARNPRLVAVVVDLPVVCCLGERHVSAHAEASRIRFQPANALCDPLPADADLVVFKSFLHDWPAEGATRLLQRSVEALAPGGTLVVFERAPFGEVPGPLPFAAAGLLPFVPYLRETAWYARQLTALGLEAVEVGRVDLDMSFQLVTARKRQ